VKFLHIIKRSAAKIAGLKLYASHKPCANGHFSERRVSCASCLECKGKYYEENKVVLLGKCKARRDAKPDHARAADRERARIRRLADGYAEAEKKKRQLYYQANRESIREKQNKKNAEQKEQKRIGDRAYYLANKETVLRKNREYRKKNPEIKRALHQKRRAIKSGADGKFTSAEIYFLLEKQRCMCALCSCKLKKSGENKFHMDHIKPLSKGGSNWISNIQLTCPSCNLRKNDKDPFEFAKQNGKLL
jgi:5-methylcytosine-specific restriction endonuclease McrA